MLTVKRLSAFYGEAQALRDVELQVGDDEIVSVIGPNGAGKTTLVHVLAGILRDRTGEIILNGRDLTGLAGHRVCDAGIAIVPEGRRVFSGMSVQDNLELGAYRGGARSARSDRLARVHELFPILKARARQRAGTLSGGEQQMLAVARALMADPRVLLLDEPSLGLAPVVVDALFDALEEVHAAGVSILLVEQNVTRALAISQRGYLLNDGAIVRSGPASDLLADPEVQRICLGV